MSCLSRNLARKQSHSLPTRTSGSHPKPYAPNPSRVEAPNPNPNPSQSKLQTLTQTLASGHPEPNHNPASRTLTLTPTLTCTSRNTWKHLEEYLKATSPNLHLHLQGRKEGRKCYEHTR